MTISILALVISFVVLILNYRSYSKIKDSNNKIIKDIKKRADAIDREFQANKIKFEKYNER